MDTTVRSNREESTAAFERDERREVAALRSAPGRLVFVEDDNTDGWIATDYAVEPRP